MARSKSMKRLFSRSQRGDAIVESMVSMLVISLVLFGLLQIFYLSVAQLEIQYASFKAARAGGVGLADYLVTRVAQTAVIGASGELITPPRSYDSLATQAASEIFPLPTIRYTSTIPGLMSSYQSGITYLDYEYWREGYGGDTPSGYTYFKSNANKTSLWTNISSGASVSTGTAGFSDYPLNFPMRSAFTSETNIDISSQAKVVNSMNTFMD